MKESVVSVLNSWNDVNRLPIHNGDGWAVWQKGHRLELDLASITERVRRWSPTNPLLIGEPGSKRFLPPICVAQFQTTVLRATGRHLRNIIVPFAVCAVVFLALATIKPSSKILPLGVLMALMASIFAIELYGSLHHKQGIVERAMFFYWLRNVSSARQGFVFWVCLGLAMVSAQLLLQQALGGMEAVFQRYGVMYPAVRGGDFWRLLSGPYFHYSILHFVSNLALLLLVGPIVWALFGFSTVYVFVIGNIVAAVAQMCWGGSAFDNFGGVSGGVNAVFGILVMAGALERDLLPKGFVLLCAGLAVLGIASSEVLSENAATVAHISGAAVGLVAGAMYAKRLRRPM